MPDSLASNSFLVGHTRQPAEGTVTTTAEYTSPLLNGERPAPTRPTGRIAGTDGNAIEPDLFYAAGQAWQTTGPMAFPAFDDLTGRLLSYFYPTDTPSGVAPTRSHAFSGLGTAPPWITLWANGWTNGASPEYLRCSKGHATSLEFVADKDVDGSMVHINLEAIGTDFLWNGSAPTVTTAETFQLTYLRALGATLKFEEDNATPATQINIQKYRLKLNRPTPPGATVDGAAVQYLSPGIVSFEYEMDLWFANFDGYRATFMGSAGGTGPSATRVDGSVELNSVAVGPNGATSTLKVSIPKITLMFDPPKPDPGASPLILHVVGEIEKPASGEHVVPTLVNNVTAVY